MKYYVALGIKGIKNVEIENLMVRELKKFLGKTLNKTPYTPRYLYTIIARNIQVSSSESRQNGIESECPKRAQGSLPLLKHQR